MSTPRPSRAGPSHPLPWRNLTLVTFFLAGFPPLFAFCFVFFSGYPTACGVPGPGVRSELQHDLSCSCGNAGSVTQPPVRGRGWNLRPSAPTTPPSLLCHSGVSRPPLLGSGFPFKDRPSSVPPSFTRHTLASGQSSLGLPTSRGRRIHGCARIAAARGTAAFPSNRWELTREIPLRVHSFPRPRSRFWSAPTPTPAPHAGAGPSVCIGMLATHHGRASVTLGAEAGKRTHTHTHTHTHSRVLLRLAEGMNTVLFRGVGKGGPVCAGSDLGLCPVGDGSMWWSRARILQPGDCCQEPVCGPGWLLASCCSASSSQRRS